MRALARVGLPLIPLAVAIAACEVASRAGLVPDYILPAPSAVWAAFLSDRDELISGLISTTVSSCAGLALSFVVGFAFAVLLSASRWVRLALLPYAIFFQTVPIISIAPLLVIWFGFGKPTVIASAFIVSIFPVIANTLLGMQSAEPALVDLFRLYSASRWDHLVKLRIPFALPNIFSGLKIAAGLAVIGAIVGEFIAGGGLGAVIDAARTRQRVDIVFAAVLLSSVLGLLLVGVANGLAWIFLRRWHASVQNLGER